MKRRIFVFLILIILLSTIVFSTLQSTLNKYDCLDLDTYLNKNNTKDLVFHTIDKMIESNMSISYGFQLENGVHVQFLNEKLYIQNDLQNSGDFVGLYSNRNIYVRVEYIFNNSFYENFTLDEKYNIVFQIFLHEITHYLDLKNIILKDIRNTLNISTLNIDSYNYYKDFYNDTNNNDIPEYIKYTLDFSNILNPNTTIPYDDSQINNELVARLTALCINMSDNYQNPLYTTTISVYNFCQELTFTQETVNSYDEFFTYFIISHIYVFDNTGMLDLFCTPKIVIEESFNIIDIIIYEFTDFVINNIFLIIITTSIVSMFLFIIYLLFKLLKTIII